MDVTCKNCGHQFDYNSVPEAGMGYVNCPECNEAVTQNKKSNMEYNIINSLVPQGEHFDATAMNDGIWVSQNHFNAIENRLAADAATLGTNAQVVKDLNDQLQAQALQAQQATEQLATATATLAERDARIAELEPAATELETANATITERDTRITELEARVQELESATPPAHETNKEKDETGGEGVTPYHESADNPFNARADRLMPHRTEPNA